MSYSIKYAGPKPITSQHGVVFDYSKEDRFEFIEILVHLIEAFNRHTHDGEVLHFSIKNHELSSQEILDRLKKYVPDLDERVEKDINEFLKEEEKQKFHVKRMQSLSSTEKDVWLKNMELVHDINLQRTINKAIYHAAVEVFGKELLKDHIKRLVIPMQGRYHHIAKSLSYMLDHLKSPVKSFYKLVETDDGLALEFDIEAIK